MKTRFRRFLSLLLVLTLLIPCLPVPGEAARNFTRLSGKDRYATSILAADALKEVTCTDTFDAIILASGTGFADALAGSYLAAVKGAPIILVTDSQIPRVTAYIRENLSDNGTVYLLGGAGAVSRQVEDSLSAYTVRRLSGANRYATNLAILEEAGLDSGEVLIATGKGFADSLSASAVGRPILLVGDALTAEQEALLAKSSGEFVIIGGTGAVSSAIEEKLAAMGNVTRLSGANRYQTSKMVAFHFFRWPTQLVLAYAQNFPDGLSGGPLAYALGAPLMLTANGNEADASGYAFHNYISQGYVLGGQGLISDETANAIFVYADDCWDNDRDHFCDDCGEKLSECADGSRDHLCDFCGAVLSECADYSWDHICDYCYQRIDECYSEDGDHFCDYCGGWLSDCADTDSDHLCDTCGVRISDCADENRDHDCDICGFPNSYCEDTDADGICDICGWDLSSCADNDSNHYCDDCGKRISYCIDEDRDHHCDVCNYHFSDCADNNSDEICDICGLPMPTDACADNDKDHFCDDCGARLSYCSDINFDHYCNVCEKLLCSCWDSDHNHTCEYCGQVFTACEDSDGDFVCDCCGIPWGISERKYSTPYDFPDVGYITTEEETIDTGDFVYHIGANIFIPGYLQEISTVLENTIPQVSGLTWAGNGYASSRITDEKIHITSSRDYIYAGEDWFDGLDTTELGLAMASHREHALVAPGDLFLYSNDTIPHETSHVLRFKQSGWEFSRPLEEGISTFTSHQVLKHLEENDPTAAYYLGRSSYTVGNMFITDYEPLYSQPVEYWLQNEYPHSGNPGYCIGFRFMWYLQETYGNYAQWITDFEAAYPYWDAGYSWESEYPGMSTVLESMKQTYGEDVFDNFYPWLRENEAVFDPVWDVTYVDATDVDALNLYPQFQANTSYTELYRMDYEDLYVNLESVRTYLEDYKGIDASALTLYNPDKLTVNLYHADGSYVTVYGHEEYSLADISYIQLVGEGRLDLLRIYGYDRCKMDWE